jgi:hypothetical protein
MKKVKNDLTGKRFGRLSVIGIDDRGIKRTYYYCKCDCGNVKSIRSDGLTSGAVTSCGCRKLEQDTINLTANHKHKMSGTRIYSIWQGMKGRCYNPHYAMYERYGGRGINVCNEWKNDFSAFYEWAVQNGYSDDLTIDRIDNNKGYSPDNCRWADQETQSRNRSSNINVKIGNSTRTLTEWCEIFKVEPKAVFARYRRNGFIGIDDLFNR